MFKTSTGFACSVLEYLDRVKRQEYENMLKYKHTSTKTQLFSSVSVKLKIYIFLIPIACV